MRRLGLCLILMLATGVPARADLIALWNFNDAVTGSTGGLREFTVDRGSGVMVSDFVPANIGNAAGSTVNSQDSDTAGRALMLQAGAGTANNGRQLAWFASTAGYADISVSFAAQRTSTGFGRDLFQYSLDAGSTWFDYGAPFDPLTSFALRTFDLAAVPQLNNNPGAAFRIVFDGATGSTGNVRLDNLLVSGTPVPEPETWALVAIGLACSLGAAVASRRNRGPGRF